VNSSIIIVPNGVYEIESQEIEDTSKNSPHVFIYASTPNRVLDNLLLLWPRILDALPDAELHVYYGFTNAVMNQLNDQLGEVEYLV
jgi:hypothetical protein